MTDNNEVERYIKCSDCRCKYKNDDTNIAHDFGYNRLGEKFKTCVICRDKRKKKRNNSNKEEKQNSDKDEEEINDKEAVDKCIAEINYWGKAEKRYVDESDGDIISLSQNPRFNIVKNISDTIRMDSYTKYKDDPSIIKYIEDNIEIRNMGYKHPKDYVTETEPLTMVFDVEHTGCTFAYILQLSWGLYKRDGTLIEMHDYFLKPDGHIYIHPRATEKHKITYEILIQKPNTLPIQELLTKFMADVSRCEKLVAHNMKSDSKTINNELLRYGMDHINASTYCTMEETKKFCSCKDIRGRLKFPRLEELHQHLFNSPLDDTMTHNSCYDVEMCAKCYFKCRNMNI